MDRLFFLQLGLSFMVGSAFVTFCTVAAEKSGSKVGGLIGGLPSTVVVALLFIGLVQTPELASQATDVIPLVVGFNGLFLVAFAILAGYGLWIGLGGALSIWFMLSLLTVTLKVSHFGFAMAIFFLLLFFSYYLLEKRLRLPTVKGTNVRFTLLQIVSRALFSGLMITTAIYLSKMSGPHTGGVFAVFPAVFLSTLIISSRSKGVEFSRALTKPLLVSGMINVVTYAIAVRYLYPVLGLALGTLLALAISGLSASATHVFIKTKMS